MFAGRLGMKTCLTLLFGLVVSASTLGAKAQPGKHSPFTVLDDIALTHFGDIYAGGVDPVTLSPDHKLIVVHSERGSVPDDRLEDELRIYGTSSLQDFVNTPANVSAPEPEWTIQESTNKDGYNRCLISRIRWLDTSDSFAFILRNEVGHDQLFLADLTRRTVTSLTPPDRDVTGFSIRDKDHYVFSVKSLSIGKKFVRDDTVQLVLHDETLFNLLSPTVYGDRSDLWAAIGGPAEPVINQIDRQAIALYVAGTEDLTLSPNGQELLTQMAVKEVPKEWETHFPPPYPGFDSAIKTSQQDVNGPYGMFYVSKYVKVHLRTGAVVPLIDGPTANRAGWYANRAAPAWSDDNTLAILPGAYPPNQNGSESRPCVAVKRLEPDAPPECVLPFKRNLADGFEAGYENITNVAFVPGQSDAVIIAYVRRDETSNALESGHRQFNRDSHGRWILESDHHTSPSGPSLKVEVKMSYRESPKLVATDIETGLFRVIWDPNPNLSRLDLGEPSLYHWNDTKGKQWHAILYMPNGHTAAHRYPLVIQNHGYNESKFDPSEFPSAFVAQELASAGIVVLQMQDCLGRSTPSEGPCNVQGYESAVESLTAMGLVDPNRIGINGFSRTVYYVMEALTNSKLRFKAASITDGVNLGYFQHILASGWGPVDSEDLAMIGAEPFGPGLHQWMARSPEFNLDKVDTPLRIVGLGTISGATMWEPYALLREMHKPVEFVLLNTEEHILTNPRTRLAAQGGNVDWFRFWLQGYEDPDPSKSDQYKRWKLMRGHQR